MSSRVEAGMKEVLQKALAVSRELETLQKEHQTLLVRARSSEEITSCKCYSGDNEICDRRKTPSLTLP